MQVDKLRWFDEGAHMLRLALAHRERARELLAGQNLYACPCCLMAYPRDAVAAGILTVEHVPPRALGGRGLLLTCAACNSQSGTHFDRHAVLRSAAEDFLHRRVNGRAIPATAYVDDIPLRGTAQWVDGALEFIGVPRQNHPKLQAAHIEAMDSHLESGSIGPNTKITAQGRFNDRAARISWIRSAYLAAFAALGWSYIMRAAMDSFRRQFKEPETRILSTYVLRNPATAPTARRILLVDDPEELRCVAVVLGEYTVFLPGLNHPLPCEDLAEAIACRRGAGDRIDMDVTGKEVPWPRWPMYFLDRHAAP